MLSAAYPYGHHLVPWSYAQQDGFIPAAGVQALSREIDEVSHIELLKTELKLTSAETIFLSSEEFDILDRSEFAAFRADFSEYEFYPVLFLRNLPDLLMSMYQTSVVYSGYRHGLTHFCDNQRSRLDISDFVSDLIAVFGRCSVVNFDAPHIRKDSYRALSLIDEFPAALDLAQAERSNESHPAYVVELCRLLNNSALDSSVAAKFLASLPTGKSDSAYTLYEDELEVWLLERYKHEVLNILQETSAVCYDLTCFRKAPSVGVGRDQSVYVGDLQSAFHAYLDDML